MFAYLITPSIFSIEDFSIAISRHKIDGACLRTDLNTCEIMADEFVSICHKYRIKSYINTDIHQASSNLIDKFDAIHLKEKYINDIAKCRIYNKEIILSTHSLENSIHALKNGASLTTLSPIFQTKDYAKNEILGVEYLDMVPEEILSHIIALGGINTKEKVDILATYKLYGYASISLFFGYL